MTDEMVERATENASKGGHKNVEFRKGEIENLPVDDNAVYLIISNCVINLVPNKERAFKEAFRVLKAGGRLMVSDIVLLKKLPDFVKDSIVSYVGCVSGASTKDRYLTAIKADVFENVTVIDESVFPLSCVSSDPTGQAILKSLEGSSEQLKEVEGSISSIKVSGIKSS